MNELNISSSDNEQSHYTLGLSQEINALLNTRCNQFRSMVGEDHDAQTIRGWKDITSRDSRDLTVHKLPASSGPFSAAIIKAETTVNHSATRIFKCLSEPAEKMKYDAQVSRAERVSELNNHTIVDRYCFKTPWPTKSRDIAVVSHWRVLPSKLSSSSDNNNSKIPPRLMVVTFSLPAGGEAERTLVPQETRKFVRAEVVLGGWLITPTGANKCRVVTIVGTALGGKLPSSIVEKVMEQQAWLPKTISQYLSSGRSCAEPYSRYSMKADEELSETNILSVVLERGDVGSMSQENNNVIAQGKAVDTINASSETTSLNEKSDPRLAPSSTSSIPSSFSSLPSSEEEEDIRESVPGTPFLTPVSSDDEVDEAYNEIDIDDIETDEFDELFGFSTTNSNSSNYSSELPQEIATAANIIGGAIAATGALLNQSKRVGGGSGRKREIVGNLLTDLVPVMSTASNVGFKVAKKHTKIGFSLADKFLDILADASSEIATGIPEAASNLGGEAAAISTVPISVGGSSAAMGLKMGQAALQGVGEGVQTILNFSSTATDQTIDGLEIGLDSLGFVEGKTYELAFGEDKGQALMFLKTMCKDVGVRPPKGMNWAKVVSATKALSWIQRTSQIHDPIPQSADDKIPLRAPALLAEEHMSAAGAAAVDMDIIRHYNRFALASYGHIGLKVFGTLPWYSCDASMDQSAKKKKRNRGAICHLTGVSDADIVSSDWKGTIYRPGHIVLLDHDKKAVVLSIRGTMRMHDVLTDGVCESVDLQLDEDRGSGKAHKGFLKAAQNFQAELVPQLKEILAAHDDYSLVLTGHSLGAGAATVLSALLGPKIKVGERDVNVRAFVYAPPCSLSIDLARSVATHVTACVIADDMVSRFGVASVIDWKETVGALYNEDGLLEKIHERRKHRGGSQHSDEENFAFADSLMTWLRTEVATQQKLYPAGLIVHSTRNRPLKNDAAENKFGLSNSSFVFGVEPSFFDQMIFSGGSMFSSHSPFTYSAVFNGDCREKRSSSHYQSR